MGILWWRGRTSKAVFRANVLEVLRAQLPQVTVLEEEDLGIVMEWPGGAKSRVWLGRAYEEFTASPQSRDDIIERWMHVLAVDPTATVDPQRLVPMIKHATWVRDQQAATQDGDTVPEFWTDPYNAELLIAYGEYNQGITYHARDQFVKAGLDFALLREQALENLRNVVGPRTVTGEGVYLVGAGGNFEASLLLIDDLEAFPGLEIDGDILIGVSDRDSLWISGDRNPQHVFRIAEAVTRCHRTEPYPVSAYLFRKVDGRYQPLDLGEEDESHPIPRLDVIDVHATKKDGGSDLSIVIAAPMASDARSVWRLARKLDGYLQYVASTEYRRECGEPAPERTSILVHLHPESDAAIYELLESAAGWVRQRNALLKVETLEVPAP